MAALATIAATAVAALPTWSGGGVLACILLLAGLPFILHPSFDHRLGAFFGLLGLSSFTTRAVFLFPEQSLWSQYLVSTVPIAYYAIAVLPILISARSPHWSADAWGAAERLCAAYIALALLNTWYSSGSSIESKAAATFLLILPWTAFLVAASRPQSLLTVCRVIIALGAASVFYAAWQIAFGPTVVELRWAEAAADLSIGASHLAVFLRGTVPDLAVWRVNGLQPDAFTFGMFSLTALTCVRLLRCAGEVRGTAFGALAVILGGGVALSLVRTVWVAAFVSLSYPWLASRFPGLRHPLSVFVGIILAFPFSAAASSYLYDLATTVRWSSNPVIARATTLGTLEARKDALQALFDAGSSNPIVGLGYAASPWLTRKLGTSLDLPSNFAEHNFFVEQVWYMGLPGLALLLALLYAVLAAAGRANATTIVRRRQSDVLIAYIIAVIISSFGNGGAALGYYFFFSAGALIGLAKTKQIEPGPRSRLSCLAHGIASPRAPTPPAAAMPNTTHAFGRCFTPHLLAPLEDAPRSRQASTISTQWRWEATRRVTGRAGTAHGPRPSGANLASRGKRYARPSCRSQLRGWHQPG